ncbi:uncharacterized protein LOC105420637 [Amborella trichopoda]|uniref:uncharacterized protein LOC105420637 n=1 Tax=Amborella trichopoda TaxID=13333 RepID=UPI0005D36A06|nr:uncharacterized protein LOC105420637 [Amborella trichopoda]|eukprot:XP_011623312.1 uncharacterized protein LOC105420637 [Amborella trichopoda]
MGKAATECGKVAYRGQAKEEKEESFMGSGYSVPAEAVTLTKEGKRYLVCTKVVSELKDGSAGEAIGKSNAGTPIADEVSLASFHLEGDAQLWFQLLKQESSSITWDDFNEALHSRYGPSHFCYFFGELHKLQQTGSVRDYQNQFEQLLFKVGFLSQARPVSCFISGLHKSIRTDVQAKQPTSLSAAIRVARLNEARNLSKRRANSPAPRHGSQTDQLPNRSPAIPVKRLSPAELQERRNKGLCYNCSKKFSLRYRCKKLFVIEACLDEAEGDVVMEEELAEDLMAERPKISLHAISETHAPETMKVKGKLRQAIITILVDSGSTHNFVSEKLVEKVGLKPIFGGQFEVMVASRERLAIPVASYTGAKLHMKFHIERKYVALQSLSVPDNKVVSHSQMERLTRKKKEGALLQLFSLGARQLQTASSPVSSDLQQLLDKYNGVFTKPKSLPPPRIQAHKIPLLSGQGPGCLKPYRYPHHQKAEIEKLVSEMLSSEVIHPSNSPYSSPVILVKKHDGSWRMCVNYRALNKITIKDKIPIPLIDELLDELNGAQYFSKLDLRSSYQQIHVFPKDMEKTTFRTHHNHYEFMVMPFGLTNAPSIFQALMNKAKEVFQRLKKAMTGAPVLALPDFSKKTIIECDASSSGIDVVLMQERPITFFSDALQGKQLMFSTYEK